MPKTKKDWLGLAGVCLLFGLMTWGILLIQQSEIRRYKNEGIAASARVVNKRIERERSSSSSGTDKEHYFDITYMDQSEVEASETSIDLLAGTVAFGDINIGEFQRAVVDVGRNSYEETEIGDTIVVLVLPDDLSEARLADEILNYSPILVWIFIGLFGLGMMYCLIRAVLAPKLQD